ncbi:MAG TPA: hypothetical protein VLT62_26010 [Candidatus Methylomirabilis sp.]|nr:hypothetical protein [Candidatus Methylomirabilis sp.]
MKRPVGHLTIMLLYLLTVPLLTDLRSVFDHGKAGIAYAKDGGGGGGGGNGAGGKGDGGGGPDGSGSGRGDGDGARGSESVGYEGGHGGRGESRSQDGARAGGPGHDHVGRGMGEPATGSGQAPNFGPDHRGQQGLELEVRGREAALRALDVEAHRREAEAEDRDLGIIAAATPRQ